MDVGSVTASESRDEFLQLLVTQLRHQDPLDPIKQENFLSQLAQFSTLEGIEKLNGRFEQQLAFQEESLNQQQLTRRHFFGRSANDQLEPAFEEWIVDVLQFLLQSQHALTPDGSGQALKLFDR